MEIVMDIELTATEMKVLEILWESMKPMTTLELSSIFSSLTLTTLHRITNSLESKGLIRMADLRKNSKAYARAFEPALSPKDFVALKAKSGIGKYNIPVIDLVSALIEDDTSDKIIEELENMLKEYKDNPEA
jgi:predicted transcriptional regulator